MSELIEWTGAPDGVSLGATPDGPVRLVLRGNDLFSRTGHPLVDLFTAAEQRARTSQCYVRTAVGERLRLRDVHARDDGSLEVTQSDPATGIEVTTRLERVTDSALVLRHTVRNGGTDPVVLTAVTSLGFSLGADVLDHAKVSWSESTWLAENRWRTEPLRHHLPQLSLPIHGQDGRGRWAVVSHGSWSTGEFLPMGVIEAPGGAVAWELETSSPWLWEAGESQDGVHVTGLGPTEAEHGFARVLLPGGEAFAAVPAMLAWSVADRDATIAALTRARRQRRTADLGTLPVVYNDFMNTLMGDPTSEKLAPLIEAAADTGAEVFCIDAGWFADGGDWWDTVGDWREAPHRFADGLAAVIARIRERGMIPGLWLEPEVVGTGRPDALDLPEDAYFHRHGARVVEHGRYHLDLRHPAVRRHLDAVVDALVTEYEIGFLKLDYNINPGAGTETHASSAAEGLLAHGRAYRDWMAGLATRHPGLLVENCASGAMRADPALLRVSHLQSTSDQQDFRRYPAVAVGAPMSIPPEQAGNWAYPDPAMSCDETAFAMLSGIVGRLYLSGFLHRLGDAQRALVDEAVVVHKQWRQFIASSTPAWPLGPPRWDDTALALRLNGQRSDGQSSVRLRAVAERSDGQSGALLAVWSRHHGADVLLPGIESLTQIYPRAAAPWAATVTAAGTSLSLPHGSAARLFVIGV